MTNVWKLITRWPELVNGVFLTKNDGFLTRRDSFSMMTQNFILAPQIQCLQDYAKFSIPKNDPSENEIYAYLKKITQGDGNKKNDDPSEHRRIAHSVKVYCDEKHVPIPLLLAMMENESHFNRKAKSKDDAEGLLQLMPKTAKNLAHKKFVDRTNIETNIELSAEFVSELLKKYNNDVRRMIMAYSMGEPKLAQYEKGEIQLSQETSDYVNERIPKFLNEYNKIMAETGMEY